MIINERDDRHIRALEAARAMLTAARTAPKARGNDNLECAIVEGEDLVALSNAMNELHAITGRPVYERDSANILQGGCVLLIGFRPLLMGLNCGHCGYPKCGEKPSTVPCAMNVTDVGIAIGSACATAADHRVDTRVMFSAGMGAMKLDMLPGCRQVFAIAIAAGSKNPFFDR